VRRLSIAAGSLGVALVVAVPLLAAAAPSGASAASAPTCRGETATIVGDRYQQELRGTAGRDVVVSGGARLVDTGGGDDLVCMTAGRAGGTYTVLAGAGADRVHVDTPVVSDVDEYGGHAYTVFLDDIDGIDDADDVFTGARSGVLVSSRGGDDRIDAGTGESVVFVNGTGPTYAGEVQLPGGGDLHLKGPVGPEAVIGAGAPAALWLEHEDDAPWAIDAGARTATRDGEPALSWTGPFTEFRWSTNEVRFVGTDAAEVLAGDRIAGADMAGGDDAVHLGTDRLPALLEGGPGTDEVLLGRHGSAGPAVGDLTIDLTRSRLVVDDRPAVPLTGFEDADVDLAASVTLIGDAGRNVLTALACDLTILGHGGDDRLVNWHAPGEGPFPCAAITGSRIDGGAGDDVVWGGHRAIVVRGGPGDDRLSSLGPVTAYGGAGHDRLTAGYYARKRGSVLHGQSGDDVLVGRRADDRLVGGPGRDEARGNEGRDRCRAERERGCEV
jgi:Ca2+-binding RTX toxin-like protein